MASWLQDMYSWFGFHPDLAKLLIREKDLDSPDRLQILTDKNVDDTCDVKREQGGKNANGMFNSGQHV